VGGKASNPIRTRIDRKLKLEIHKLEFNRKEKRPLLAYKAARAWKPVSCDWNTLKSGSADSRGIAAAATATNAALLLPTVGILTLPDPPLSWGSGDSVEQARIVVQADQNLFDCLLLLLVGNKHLQAAAVGDCNEQQSEVEVEAAAAEEEAMGTLAAALFAPQWSQNSSEAFPQILNTYFFKALAP
jgi:hypothetical protein